MTIEDSGLGLTRPTPRSRYRTRPDRLRVRMRARVLRKKVAAIVVALTSGAVLILVVSPGSTASDQAVVDTEIQLVATAVVDLPAGHVIGQDDVAPVEIPTALLVDGTARSPVGRHVTSPIVAGEPIVEQRLGGHNRLGLAEDEVAVALERPSAPLPLEPGDVVQLVAVSSNGTFGAVTESLDVARLAAVDDRTVIVAVSPEVALRLIEQRAVGSIELALTPWS